MITTQIKGESGHTRLSVDVDGDRATLVFSMHQAGKEGVAMITLTDIFEVSDIINIGKTLVLNEACSSAAEFAETLKSDALIDAKLRRGDFNDL